MLVVVGGGGVTVHREANWGTAVAAGFGESNPLFRHAELKGQETGLRRTGKQRKCHWLEVNAAIVRLPALSSLALLCNWPNSQGWNS